MRISLNWLKKFVNINIDNVELEKENPFSKLLEEEE